MKKKNTAPHVFEVNKFNGDDPCDEVQRGDASRRFTTDSVIHRLIAEIGIVPHLLTRAQAAAYCGVSLATFAGWVRRRIVPGPIPLTHRWDKKVIDAALDAQSCLDDKLEHNALDQWKAKQLARHTEGNLSNSNASDDVDSGEEFEGPLQEKKTGIKIARANRTGR